jgi:hypothetical protein
LAAVDPKIAIVRTADGARYEVDSSSYYPRSAGGLGERISSDEQLGEVIARIASSLSGRNRFLDSISGPNVLRVEFGLLLSPEAGFIVSQSSGKSHFAVTMEFRSDEA